MANDTGIEYPAQNEKLSYKFILDSLKEEMVAKSETAPETPEEPKAIQLELETDKPGANLCGAHAPAVTAEESFPEIAVPLTPLKLDANKKYYRIGEVSELVGVEPYVLRYWESEFNVIRPIKSSSGHRVYAKRDVEALHLIRHLLHVEKFSIKGAKKKLQEKRKETRETAQKALPNKQALREIAQELRELIALSKHSI